MSSQCWVQLCFQAIHKGVDLILANHLGNPAVSFPIQSILYVRTNRNCASWGGWARCSSGVSSWNSSNNLILVRFRKLQLVNHSRSSTSRWNIFNVVFWDGSLVHRGIVGNWVHLLCHLQSVRLWLHWLLWRHLLRVTLHRLCILLSGLWCIAGHWLLTRHRLSINWLPRLLRILLRWVLAWRSFLLWRLFCHF